MLKPKPKQSLSRNVLILRTRIIGLSAKNRLLTRHHVKARKTFFGLRYLRGTLPVDESRLTGWRSTERFYLDGTSDCIVDPDFRSNDDDNVHSLAGKPETPEWRGRTTFRLKPLTCEALAKAIEAAKDYQAPPAEKIPKRVQFRNPKPPKPVIALKPALAPSLANTPGSSTNASPPPPIVADPGVSSRETEIAQQQQSQIDRRHIVTSQNSEKTILSRLR